MTSGFAVERSSRPKQGGASRSHQRRPRYFAVILSAVAGTIVTIAAFLLVCSWEYRVAEIDFQSKAKTYVEVINAELGDAGTLLYTVASFVGSTHHTVSRPEFADFSASLHRRVPGLRDVGWAPQVTSAGRPRFERDARAAGIAGYEIRQFGADRTLVRAANRPEYYALLYVEADGSRRSVIGFDLISERRRAQAALRALRTGRPAATAPMDVLTVKQRGAGILSYMPAYALRGGDDASRVQPLGLVLGVFDIPAMLQNIVEKNRAVTGLDLYVFNPAATGDRRIIFQTGSRRSEAALRAGVHWESTALVIDQRIGVIVTPSVPLHLVRLSLFATTTVIVGLTMTAMIVGYLIISLRRTLQLEALTASLRETSAQLEAKAEEVTQMSRRDPLTGMPNRLMFHERWVQAVAHLRRGSPFALLFLDLDRFKPVNDTYGHGVGDSLLRAVATRIVACTRDVDTAARLGGDEFAIILHGIDDEARIAIVARRLISRLTEPFLIDGLEITIGVSIGGAFAVPGADPDGIIAQADSAMYAAKRAGRGTFRVYDETMRASTSEAPVRH